MKGGGAMVGISRCKELKKYMICNAGASPLLAGKRH